MATPKSVSAADLVPHSKLKVTALAPHGSDGTGLDEILAAPTAVGVAVGVAKRHATDLSPCQLNLWVLLLLSFSAIFLFTFIFPDTATIPVWLRLLCRLINCCLCYAAFLYFWTASQCVTPTDPLRLRLLYKVVIVELCFCYFFSAAKLIAEAFLEPDAVTAGPVLLGVFIGLNLIFCRAFLSPSIYLSICLQDNLLSVYLLAGLPTSCLKAESTAAETKAPVVTIHVHAFEGSKSRPPESLISLFKVVVVTFIRGAKLGTHVVVVGIQLVSIELLIPIEFQQ